jgi:hypothetical protein
LSFRKKIFFLILFLSKIISAQTDWITWDAKQISYEIPQSEELKNERGNSGFGVSILSFLKNTYSFLISDFDGDNCPFHPSCSNFFIESVKVSGFIKGSLMFADRFLRDINLIKGLKHYSRHISGKFFDPVKNYTLHSNDIIYISGGLLVK